MTAVPWTNQNGNGRSILGNDIMVREVVGSDVANASPPLSRLDVTRKSDKRISRAGSVRTRRSGRDWPSRYAGRLLYSDIFVVAGSMALFTLCILPRTSQDIDWPGGLRLPYWLAVVIIGVVWTMALGSFGARDRLIAGSGILEYRRVIYAGTFVFAVFLAIAFFLRIDVSRALFLIVLPVGTLALIASRWGWRQWLRAQQAQLKYVYRALVLAEPAKAEHIISSIERTPGTGFDIVGVVTNARGVAAIAGIPVIGGFGNAIQALDAADADTIIIAGSDELSPSVMRRLGWDAADRDVNLVVAPALTDVAGPRIHTRPAAGLPLLHVEYPTLEGGRRVAKRAFDLIGSSLLILAFAPVMVATAVAIKIDSPGPLFYQQTRIGRRGREFGMIKFRSMNADADDQLASLLDLQGSSDRPLHKVVDDPRITNVGRFIRRHSLDEIPQLINVLLGSMSLVGPRPQRPAEVALYDDTAHRRLLVKPGMSGLWQVSGRSALSWDDALRLDLYYVENWSFTQDVQILFRTVREVVFPGGRAH